MMASSYGTLSVSHIFHASIGSTNVGDSVVGDADSASLALGKFGHG